jgi:hypothetical protein
MKKVMVIVLLAATTLAWFAVQAYFDARCFEAHMSGARITPLGVYCFQNLGGDKSDFYYRLDVLEAATPVPATPPPSDSGSG